MASLIQISNITGTTPYQVSVCDFYGNNCEFMGTINTTVPPSVSFVLPSGFTAVPIVKIKVIDGDGCETIYDKLCGT
jgi:hypothetical protein